MCGYVLTQQHIKDRCKNLSNISGLHSDVLTLPENKKETSNTTHTDIIHSNNIFYKGWYPPETSDKYIYRWSKATSYINLTGLHGKYFKASLINTNPLTQHTGMHVTICNYTTKKVISTLELGGNEPDGIEININITKSKTVLMLICSHVWVPAVINNTSDWRELGIILANIEVHPLDVVS